MQENCAKYEKRAVFCRNPSSGCGYSSHMKMRVGVPREIKIHEYRVGLMPAGVRELVAAGHEVMVESGAGVAVGASDLHYQAAGASIARTAAEVFAWAELIVKVKEPQPVECRRLRPDQVLFTYLHLAADAEQARLLM